MISAEEVFLNSLQNSKENTNYVVLLTKVTGVTPVTLLAIDSFIQAVLCRLE